MNVVPENTKVALLAGGTSGEREISLLSGKGASDALVEAGFDVTVLDPSKKEDLVSLITDDFDVAFLCLHGRGGEDGTMQGMLDVIGIPYTGPGVWSSATSMDKVKSKIFYDLHGIPTPRSVTLYDKSEATPAELVENVGNHLVIKPASEGSALGVTIVEGPDEIEAALDEAFALDHEVLVETFVAGRELTVAVIGNDDPVALPIIEIVPQNDFYDFESKYAPGGSKHICPAPLDKEVEKEAMDVAIAAHKALECRGCSRTDVILDKDNVCWVLETNTIPGMTATSLLPDAGRAAGIEFSELCRKLVEYAME